MHFDAYSITATITLCVIAFGALIAVMDIIMSKLNFYDLEDDNYDLKAYVIDQKHKKNKKSI